MRLGVIDEKYDMNLGTKNRVFRFLGSFVIETFAILLFFKGTMIDMVTIMSPLIVLTIIMFSSQKQALHDVLAKSKVVDLRTAVIFESVGEKEAYDAEYMKTHQDELNFDTDKKVKKEEPIEAEVEEVIDDEDDPFMKEEEKPLELSKTSVFINDYPKGRVKDVVFAIQDVTDLNVVDAKRLLDNLPCLVKTNLEVEEANKIKEVLENVGVTVEVR
jgi:ribosomal protein L7/L12